MNTLCADPTQDSPSPPVSTSLHLPLARALAQFGRLRLELQHLSGQGLFTIQEEAALALQVRNRFGMLFNV